MRRKISEVERKAGTERIVLSIVFIILIGTLALSVWRIIEEIREMKYFCATVCSYSGGESGGAEVTGVWYKQQLSYELQKNISCCSQLFFGKHLRFINQVDDYNSYLRFPFFESFFLKTC